MQLHTFPFDDDVVAIAADELLDIQRRTLIVRFGQGKAISRWDLQIVIEQIVSNRVDRLFSVVDPVTDRVRGEGECPVFCVGDRHGASMGCVSVSIVPKYLYGQTSVSR